MTNIEACQLIRKETNFTGTIWTAEQLCSESDGSVICSVFIKLSGHPSQHGPDFGRTALDVIERFQQQQNTKQQ